MNKMNWSWPDLLAYPGTALITFGLYKCYPAAAYIFIGVVLFALAIGIRNAN